MINLPMTIRLSEDPDTGKVKSEVLDWTPVTEALPDHDGEYLVTTVNDCGTRRRQVSSFVLFNGGACYSWGIETSPMYKVLAWCELPPEWEEETHR